MKKVICFGRDYKEDFDPSMYKRIADFLEGTTDNSQIVHNFAMDDMYFKIAIKGDGNLQEDLNKILDDEYMVYYLVGYSTHNCFEYDTWKDLHKKMEISQAMAFNTRVSN